MGGCRETNVGKNQKDDKQIDKKTKRKTNYLCSSKGMRLDIFPQSQNTALRLHVHFKEGQEIYIASANLIRQNVLL